MNIRKIYLSRDNIFLFDDLLGDFYNELQAYHNNLFMNYAEDLILDDSSYFILDESNTIIGFYSLTPYNSQILRYLYIKPMYRGMNYGTSIIEHLLKENQILKLNCSINNKNGISFYNKFNGTKTINNDEVTYEIEL
jgi:GNAT superfamily N-acetyltransferase